MYFVDIYQYLLPTTYQKETTQSQESDAIRFIWFYEIL